MTKLYSGYDCVLEHSQEIAALGSKALIVTGRHSAKACGALQDVTEALDKEGLEYTIFDKIEENPSVETVLSAAAIGLEKGSDFVIGIGGGSPCDGAKAIAFAIKHGGSSLEELYDKNADGASLPVVAVPTTCGTGSEVTGVSVLTRHDKETKQSIPHKIFPDLSLVDGKYLAAAGDQMIKNTSVDALAHLIESYINTTATGESRDYVSQGLEKWALCKDLLQNPKEASREERQLLMDVATLAGRAIAVTGTGIPHALSYPITYRLGLAHGPACAMFLGRYVANTSEVDQNFIFEKLGLDDIEEFEKLLLELCPTVDIPKDMKKEMADNLSKDKARLSKCPYPVDLAILQNIIG